jgi:flap endonuclease-1
MVRFLAIASTEFLPSRGRARFQPPEVIDLEENLQHLGLTQAQLIDVAILVGTDFNEGVKGIGAKTAVKRIREWKSLEQAPGEVSAALPANLASIREFFAEPPVSTETVPTTRNPDDQAVYRFLCDERNFAHDRVQKAVERLHPTTGRQTTLDI